MSSITTIEACFDAAKVDRDYLSTLNQIQGTIAIADNNLKKNYYYFGKKALVNQEELPLTMAADYITASLEQCMKDIGKCYNVIRYKAWRNRSKDLQSVIDYCTQEESSINSKISRLNTTSTSSKTQNSNSSTNNILDSYVTNSYSYSKKQTNSSDILDSYVANSYNYPKKQTNTSSINAYKKQLESIQELKREAMRQKDIADRTATTF